MITRRSLLVATTSAMAITSLAGCSSESSSEPESDESTPEEESEEKTEPSSLPSFGLEKISFEYGFSNGLTTNVILQNETDGGSGINTVNISVEAFDEGTSIGEANQWRDIQAEQTGEFNLTIESLSELSEPTLEGLTELRIRGKEVDEEYIELDTFSGATVRNRLEE